MCSIRLTKIMISVVVGAALVMACDSDNNESNISSDDTSNLPAVFSESSETIVLRKLAFSTELIDGKTIQCRTFPDYSNETIDVDNFEAQVPNTFTERRYNFNAQTMMLSEVDPFGGTVIDYVWSIEDGNIKSDAWRWWFLGDTAFSREPLSQFAQSLGNGIWSYYKTTHADLPSRVVTNLYACRFFE